MFIKQKKTWLDPENDEQHMSSTPKLNMYKTYAHAS
jgi:hypothetical protein